MPSLSSSPVAPRSEPAKLGTIRQRLGGERGSLYDNDQGVGVVGEFRGFVESYRIGSSDLINHLDLETTGNKSLIDKTSGRVIVVSDDEIQLVHYKSAKIENKIQKPRASSVALSISPHSDTLFIVSEDGNVTLLNLKTLQQGSMGDRKYLTAEEVSERYRG